MLSLTDVICGYGLVYAFVISHFDRLLFLHFLCVITIWTTFLICRIGIIVRKYIDVRDKS